MFPQLLTPIGGSLGLSFAVATLPIVAVLVMLGVLRRPAWQAALSGLIVGLVIAIAGWEMPAGLAAGFDPTEIFYAQDVSLLDRRLDGGVCRFGARRNAQCFLAGTGHRGQCR